jgi:putative flippase GtrA
VTAVRRERALELLRYLVVSGSGVLVNIVTFAVLRAWAIPTVVCGTLAFAAACRHNVTWHARVTFGGATAGCRTSLRFLGLSLATLGVSLGVLAGLHRVGVGSLVAQAAGILAACPLNFLGSRLWVFAA